jgi:Flp pilus assembly protein CpaB
MRSRGLVVVLALILATLATVGVFLYSRGVKEEARTGGDLVTVVVAKTDIPANTDLNQLIAEGQFETLALSREAVIADAVTQISQLEGRRNSVFIFQGEQIPLGRVQGGEVPGGLLSIPEGHQAMTVALDAPRAISGTLAGGDNIAIYATFTQVEIVKLNKKFETVGTTTNGSGQSPRFDTTVVLVPEVEVLRVIREDVGGVAGETQDATASSAMQVILALTPEEAQKLVFSLEMGQVYLTLLAPDERGVALDPLTAAKILVPGGPAETGA